MPNEFWSARLGLCILNQRALGESSSFTPYLESLPAQIGTPVFWQREAVEALQPALRVQVNKRARFLAGFAHEHLASGDALRGVAADVGAMAWGCAAASSRAFRLKQGRAMLPLIDSGNRFDGNAEVRSRADGGVELVASSTAIAAGEEVTFSYGALSNDDYLLDYGFIPRDNPYDDRARVGRQLRAARRGARRERRRRRGAFGGAAGRVAARGAGAAWPRRRRQGFDRPGRRPSCSPRARRGRRRRDGAPRGGQWREAARERGGGGQGAPNSGRGRRARARRARRRRGRRRGRGGGRRGDGGGGAACHGAAARDGQGGAAAGVALDLGRIASRRPLSGTQPKKKKAADKPKACKGGRGGSGFG